MGDKAKPRLKIPAYDIALYAFMSSVMDGLAAVEPTLGQIPIRVTGHAGPTRNVPGPRPVDHPLATFNEEFAIHTDVVRNSDVESFVATLTELAEKHVEAIAKALVQMLSDVTEGVGNVVDVGGRPISWDHFLDGLEKIEVSFDEEGRHQVQFAMNPNTAMLLEAISVSPEQRQRHKEIVRRKKEQWDAQKRTRRLPRQRQGEGL